MPRGYCATSYQKYSDFDLSAWQRCTRISQPGGHAAEAVALDHSRIGHRGAQGLLGYDGALSGILFIDLYV